MQDKKWSGRTPASLHEIAAEQVLLRQLHEKGEWDLVGNAWAAAAFTEGSLVRRKADKHTAFVVRRLSAAVLMWPAQCVEPRVWHESLAVERLDWQVVYDLGEWEEIPVELACPLHLFLEDCAFAFTRHADADVDDV